MTLLARIGPDGIYAATDADGDLRFLHADPFAEPPSAWRFGRRIDPQQAAYLPPVRPGKIVGVGRNFAAHARELGNPVPDRPLVFLKSPSAVIGPAAPVILPPESEQVEHEGEIALVLGRQLRRADEREARDALLGITAACDVTARDIQRRDGSFARAKSFDTFCPLGPVIRMGAELDDLTVTTRVNGETRQHATVREMLTPPLALLAFISRTMTLEPGDIVLTGTPAGVAALEPGDLMEVEVSGVGVLRNPIEARPAEARPAEARPAEAPPAEAPPAEAPPAG